MPSPLGRLGGIVVVAILLLPGGAWAFPARATARVGQSGLGLTVTPTDGVAPLLVRFSVTPPNATTPNLAWTFGDGAYLNGSFQDARAPAHAYERAGTYEAIVAAHYGGGDVTVSATIVVVASNLSASMAFSPSNGSAPLTVWLNGTPEGGSGTYVTLDWEFGDGHSGSGLSVEYTYTSSGSYVANFTVMDTLNDSAEASATILVAGDPPNDSGAGSQASGGGSGFGVALSPPTLAGAVVAGAAVLAAVGAWMWSARRRTGTVVPPLAMMRSTTPSQGPGAPSGTVTSLETRIPHAPSTRAGPTQGAGDRAGANSVDLAAPSFDRPRGYHFVGTRQLSFRVLTLLLESRDARATPSFSPTGTQADLAERLGVGQSAVSKVLHQLVLGGLVEVTSAHVAGASRRVRVYRLTPKGDRLARALREGSSERAQ